MSFEQKLFNAIKNGQVSVKSVYDIWLELGNTGTPQDFLNSLKGTSTEVTNGVTIASTAWVLSDGIYKATVSNSEITDKDVVNVKFQKSSMQAALTAGVLGYTDSIAGGFELFANFKPTVDLIIDYAIIPNE